MKSRTSHGTFAFLSNAGTTLKQTLLNVWLLLLPVYLVSITVPAMAHTASPVVKNYYHRGEVDTAKQVNVSINFQPATAPVPVGFIADVGSAYDNVRGYGWINTKTKLPEDHSLNMRFRKGTAAVQFLTVAQMQATNLGQTPGNWEFAVPNGTYRVIIGAGDNVYDNDMQINVEGLPAINDFKASAPQNYKISTVVVAVTDGKITLDAKGGLNTRVSYVTITNANPVTDTVPPVSSVRVTGTAVSSNVYKGTVKVYIRADDTLSGLKQIQYSINNSLFKNYTSPLSLTIPADYSIIAKATDANGNQTITPATNFKITGNVATGQYLFTRNLDNFPSNDRMVFSLIQTPWRRTDPDTTPYNANHDKVKLRLANKGTGPLTISKLQLSNPASWKIFAIGTDTSLTLPIQILPAGYIDVGVQFVANNVGTRVKILIDTLTILSNDSIAPVKKTTLSGIWQVAGESTNEPFAQQLEDAFGFKTTVGYGHDDGDINGSTRVPNSDEVAANYFVVADPTKPVSVYQMASYHSCCLAIESFKYYYKGTSTFTSIITENNLDGQSVMPRKTGSQTLLAQATFVPSNKSFGFKIGSSFSDRTLNFNGLIGTRFLKVIDANGNIVPNAYIMDCDYLNTPFTNYDYQDNVYYIDNIKPETGSLHYSVLTSTPASVNFESALTGATTTIPITLTNTGKTYADTTQDPSIKITSIKIVGPNAAEFSVGSLKSSTIAIQTSTVLNVNFVPASLGIKNAALLISYGSATALRVPLYGNANTSLSLVKLIKRIKGGSDTVITASGRQYEADKLYRAGSVKLDRQVILGPVAATDDYKIYQSYLSSNTDLLGNHYDIPVPNGNYFVRLHFVENYWTSPGSRVFSVALENNTVLANYDIFNDVGYRAVIVKDFPVAVNDGSLSIQFTPTANRPAIAAVEIFQATDTGSMAKSDTSLTSNLRNFSTPAKLVTIYPNPNTGNILNLKVGNFGKLEIVTVTVSNMMGVKIHSQTFMTDSEGAASLPIVAAKKLDKGIYIINSYANSGKTQSKLIVE